ncbi:PREDICTED: prickle-like protein 4 [Gavialis gangeticus]|uniref:prickle-like protein 4 n=1 Tax=Gavialis gangeticus TaxID=94835 RepID=UPI00092F4A7C|nr:PREDICTED: prickle-like protein 4 [Gavialis gangeticus]
MSLPSSVWPQRDVPPCSGTQAGLPPTSSSDSDSGCALEEYLEPTADSAPTEASLCLDSPSAKSVPAAVANQHRIKALLQQLPPQDCDERYCPGLGEEERQQLEAFSTQRRQEALGQGSVCPVPPTSHECLCKRCGKRMNKGDPAVFASWLGDHCCWHPSCFVCHSCCQPLVDLIYFHQDGNIYCGRHHAELFRPRCASCDQLIFAAKCIEAEGRRWHVEHFCCLECDLPLGGQRYVMKSGRPCCCSCFESLYAELCQACGELIGADSEQATHQGQHWHASPSCFCCSSCRKPLLGEQLASRHGLPYCSETCSREKERASSSSTASDSSDSAFLSTPSPESTPVPRASRSSSSSRSSPMPTPAADRDTCKPGAAADGTEEPSAQTSIHPAFWSQDDQGALLRERGKGATSVSAFGQAAAASPEQDLSSMHPHCEVDQSVLRASPVPIGDPQADISALYLGASPSADSSVTVPQNLAPPKQTPRHWDAEEDDDARCPTCSSSSDSEQEGFFFGEPIPKPGTGRPATPSWEYSNLGAAAGTAARLRASSKHCSIS